ncbi:MAG: toll/interleukin-1 receptor domain-containing protein [Oscillospiraceae bacterium]|nr:toll/interleukin-1 receptor domain-containing protein [Oscillospiraceae bacterium]
MRIFISHATKNEEIVLRFAKFLEIASSDIEAFCSSEKGSIGIGKNFVETIFSELDHSDLFIPIISKEYYESRFCMFELGVAYSYLYNKKKEEYIFPFSLYPILKGQALSGTPIANIQTGDLNDEKDIHSFLEYLSADKGIKIGTGINRKLHSFIFDVEQIFLKHQNIMEMARIGAYFDDSIEFNHREDIASTSIADNMIIINYNMNPYEKKDIKYPNFISMVLRYVDKLDISRYLDFNNQAEFRFVVINFTNSLKQIFIEFKYSDSNRILETFKFSVGYGENKLSIPLENMRSEALKHISEICFVIHPDDVVEEEGMYKIGKIEIR